MPEWLALALRHLWATGFFAANCNKWIGQAGINTGMLADVDILVPHPDEPERSLAEQRRIVTRIETLLEEVREARKINQAIIEDTDRLMDAVLREVFGDLLKKYPEAKLGDNDLCQVIPGQHIMSDDYRDFPDGTPYITGPADFGRKFPSISKWTQVPKVLSQPGDILFTVKGSGVGKVNCAPAEETCAIGRQIMALRPNRDWLIRDFLAWFKTPEKLD